MIEQLLARVAGLALPGQVTRERLSDSTPIPSGHQAPAPPLCGFGSQLGSCGHTLLSAEQGTGADPGSGGRWMPESYGSQQLALHTGKLRVGGHPSVER